MTTNVAMRHVLLYPNDGIWVAEVPSLPGTMSQGTTREEAITSTLSLEFRAYDLTSDLAS